MADDLGLLDKISKNMDNSATALGAVLAKLNEPKTEAKVEEPKAEKDVAKVDEGMLGGLTKTEFFNVPIGKIAVGTFGGVFISEVVDGFLSKQGTMIQGAAKIGMAGLVAGMGRRWMGSDVTYAIAFVLGVFGLSQVLPIDKYAAAAAGTIKGFLPGTIKVVGMPGGAVAAAESVAGNYYSRMLGGR